MVGQTQAGAVLEPDVEITEAAIGAYGRLFRAVGRALRTHAARDGGLICEDRTVPARPIMWRISPEGVVLADSRYNFGTGGFAAAVLPCGLSSG